MNDPTTAIKKPFESADSAVPIDGDATLGIATEDDDSTPTPEEVARYGAAMEMMVAMLPCPPVDLTFGLPHDPNDPPIEPMSPGLRAHQVELNCMLDDLDRFFEKKARDEFGAKELGPVTVTERRDWLAHPLADEWPMMDDTERFGLEASIRSKGLIDPVVIYEDRVLDGRNRLAAIIKFGLALRIQHYVAGDPAGFVSARNNERRHMNSTRNALTAEKMATGRHGGDRTKTAIAVLSLDDCAKMMGVHVTAVERVRQVRIHAPAIYPFVWNGLLKPAPAAIIAANVPLVEQDRLAEQGASAIRAAAAAIVKAKRAKPTVQTTPEAEHEPAPPTAPVRNTKPLAIWGITDVVADTPIVEPTPTPVNDAATRKLAEVLTWLPEDLFKQITAIAGGADFQVAMKLAAAERPTTGRQPAEAADDE